MKKISTIIVVISTLILVGCSTHTHTVGAGPQSGQSESATQWYVLFGLIPLNDVDTGAMAGGSSNYEIQTTTGAADIIIGGITSYVTVTRRTVTVTK